ncbi:MAG TPA: FtsX-like permease family protein [Streptosporangiaceae bacterium]|nr:FtsX-like permease family protein [Streptosporangiaceae bacterium]
MIGLGLRLVISGGREAVTRFLVLAVAVGLGVGLLLTAVAATNAVTTWNNSHAWLWTGTSSVPPGPAPTGVAPLWWHPSSDIFEGRNIYRFDVAATGASSPVPPGIRRDPGPGQYYASPALAALLRSTPADELGDRYPGRLAGVIGDAALSSPDSLVIVIGHTPAQLAGTPGSAPVTSIATTLSGSFSGHANPKGLNYSPPEGGIQSSGIDLILSVVALAMLAPVLIFIATATRLSAARREQRFAAMRLVGATRRQVSLLAATESTAAAILGVAAGFGIFFLLRAPVAGIPFLGEPFFPADMSLSPLDILAVAIGVPVAAAVAARLALRRVHISPLGVARRATPRPPRAWRVLPLLTGLAELGFFVVHGTPASPGGEVWALLSGSLLIIVGLVIAGPWLTMAAARVMARRTSRPGALSAARRLADDPQAAFRAVSGLVLALFITTVAVVGITTQDAKNVTTFASPAAAAVVTDQLAASGLFTSPQEPAKSGAGPAAPATPLAAQLRRIPGVQGVVVVRADPGLTIPGAFHNLGTGPGSSSPIPVPAGVVSCAQLATVPALGRCPAGVTAVAFPQDGFDGPLDGRTSAGITWPAVNVPASRLDTLAVDAINVGTNGSVPTVERARTALENAPGYSAPGGPSTIGDLISQNNSANDAYQQLANTVILVSLPIAGCTLAAAIAAGLADRKRPFSLLRLTGARLATLRRVVALESAVPLLAVAAVAIGTGFAAAAEYASVAQHYPMVAPGAAYYLIAAGGILVSLGIIAATFPLLARITGPEVARNE